MKALFTDHQSPIDRANQEQRRRRARFWLSCRDAERAPRVRGVFYWALVCVLWAFALSNVFGCEPQHVEEKLPSLHAHTLSNRTLNFDSTGTGAGALTDSVTGGDGGGDR